MASYLYIFAAEDAHIDFIAEHPETLWDYVNGKAPDQVRCRKPRGLLACIFGGSTGPDVQIAIPANWTTKEVEMIGPEICHRNVSLYHRLLNGSPELAAGAGSIFQTWMDPLNHSAIDISGHGEHFAFKSHMVPALAELASAVDLARARREFSAWQRSRGEEHNVDDRDCEEFVKEFADFSDALNGVVVSSRGIIWICS